MNTSFFDDYFKGVKYPPPDAFGIHEDWNREYDKMLKFLNSVDKNYYEKSKSRIKRVDERNAFLAEITAMYFIGGIKSLEITQIEPKGNVNHLLDFQFKDKEDALWDVEVKHPSWKKEVMKDEKLSYEEKLKRLKKEKNITGEGRFYSDRDAIDDAIKKAVPKFIEGKNNLILIVPDMFAITGLFSSFEDMIREEVRGCDIKNTTSSVLVLQPILFADDKELKYKTKLVQISKIPLI